MCARTCPCWHIDGRGRGTGLRPNRAPAAATSATPDAALPGFSGAWAHPGMALACRCRAARCGTNRGCAQARAIPISWSAITAIRSSSPRTADILKKLARSHCRPGISDPDSQCLRICPIFLELLPRCCAADKVTSSTSTTDDFAVRLTTPHPAR